MNLFQICGHAGLIPVKLKLNEKLKQLFGSRIFLLILFIDQEDMESCLQKLG